MPGIHRLSWSSPASEDTLARCILPALSPSQPAFADENSIGWGTFLNFFAFLRFLDIFFLVFSFLFFFRFMYVVVEYLLRTPVPRAQHSTA